MAEEVEMTPITPSEGGSVPPKLAPFSAASDSTPAPAASDASTIKLKPVIRKPMIHKPTIGGAKPMAAPVAPAAKKATQNLKSVTGPIPAQATLKKTGIIAEGVITQQQQAAKSKTSRISLESAIGVSPTKEGPAPLKTIRLRRPTDLKPASGAAPAVPPPAESSAADSIASASAPVSAAPDAAATPAANDAAGVTQKKTLKLQRPGSVGIKRPSLGVVKPAADGDVPEIGDMGGASFAPVSPLDLGGAPEAGKSDVPSWLAAMSLAVAVAALLVAGFLAYNFVGQNPTGTDANEMAVVSF